MPSRWATAIIWSGLRLEIAEVWFSPSSQLFAVKHTTKPTELRRVDGSLITTFADQVSILFSPDGRLLEVNDDTKPTELRRADGSLITALAGCPHITFSPDSRLFVTHY